MNYHQARQRKSDGRWDWSTRNDESIWTAMPCSNHEDGHGTAEDAERHFYDYEAANLREMHTASASRCEGLHDGDAPWTDRALKSRLYGSLAYLCDEHRNREGWERVNPFRPGIQITASW